mmetsp:Transcript_6351/g.18751  ORF Transcript_6351/g.18751 Transcript_6351/m.18751 type:complete len:135 (+) Transcript_6351:361-765(+)
MGDKVVHEGGCHCRRVRWRVTAAADLIAWDCNCSVCAMKRNVHFIVPAADFELLSGADDLVEYRFLTNVARHLFCGRCGVQSYYHPRSNPDGVGITVACVDEGTINSVEVRHFDGVHWEESYEATKIASQSKSV